MTIELVDVDPIGAGCSPTRLERITAHLQRAYVDSGKIAGCQVAVSRRGRLAYLRSFGLQDRERGTAMRDDAIFRIYSMTKPITSVALMTLYEHGLFRLDDPVARFFPSWRDPRVWLGGAGDAMVTEPAHRPVSIRDVLSHMGGLTYGGGLPGVGVVDPVDEAYRAAGIGIGVRATLPEFMDRLAQVPLRYQPGTAWAYSFSTDVCGALVERISGKPFEQYLHDVIFEPLGMVDTAFQVAADKADRFAANYGRAADKSVVLLDDPTTSPFLRPPAFVSGGGGLTSTIADYVRFAEMLRRGGELDGVRILNRRTIELMTRNLLPGGEDLSRHAIGPFSETAYDGIGFGLGFAVTIDQTRTGGLSSGDYYWGGAASTIFWVDPEEELSVVFMTQLMPSATFDFRGQLKAIIYSSLDD